MDTRRLRCAVIPTRDRPDDFADCYKAIASQVDVVIVVSHGAEYAAPLSLDWPDSVIVGYHEDPPNISRMWNRGIATAAQLAQGFPYDVAILNDDVIVPEGWFSAITHKMRVGFPTAVAAGAMSPDVVVATGWGAASSPLPRMPGFAFILNGDKGLRADEQFQWWFGDTDLDWRARQNGGMVLVPLEGRVLEHRHPNSTTVGVLADIAAQDRERFAAKWGAAPW